MGFWGGSLKTVLHLPHRDISGITFASRPTRVTLLYLGRWKDPGIWPPLTLPSWLWSFFCDL